MWDGEKKRWVQQKANGTIALQQPLCYGLLKKYTVAWYTAKENRAK